MTAIVLEIQGLASESKSDILGLLRKTLLVATKLDLEDLRKWVYMELNGFDEFKDLPEYRKIPARITVWNPFHGNIPLIIQDSKFHDIFCTAEIYDPIAAIVDLVENFTPNAKMIYPLTPKQLEALLNSMSGPKLTPTREITPSSVRNILEQVKNTILNWTIELEKKGVLGENLSFSPKERDSAKEFSNIKIHNFHGVFGNISHSSVVQSGGISISKNDFPSLATYLRENKVSNPDIESLQLAISSDPLPKKSNLGPNVSNWIGNMVMKAASGTWQVGLEAAGNLLAKGIELYYDI